MPRSAIPARNDIGGDLRAAGKGGANAGVRRGIARRPILAGPLGARYTGGMETPEKRRWFRPTPGWLVLGSLAATGLLFLSERWRWFWFNEHKGWTVLVAVAAVGAVLLAMLLWLLVALVFRWRFQFGIRTLLVMVVAVALPCSWLSWEMQKARQQREAIAEIAEPVYGYDWQVDENFNWRYVDHSPTPPWLQRSLGDDFFCDVITANLSARRVKLIDKLPRLQELRLEWEDASDADLSHVKSLKDLRVLQISSDNLTDDGLASIAGLRGLEMLFLRGEKITAAGLKNIEDLTQLRELNLQDLPITDAGLAHLAGLKQLRKLTLRCTNIDGKGLTHLKQLPELQELELLSFELPRVEPPDEATIREHDRRVSYITQLTQLRTLMFNCLGADPRDLEKLRRELPQCAIDWKH